MKWPNDLFVNSGKLGGLLIETKIDRSEIIYAIAGVGLNVNLNANQIPHEATSVFLAAKRKYDLRKMLQSALGIIREDYERPLDSESILGEWWDHCDHRMQAVKIETPEGFVRGRCVGINPDGSILVETGNGQITTVADGTLRAET